MAVSKRLRYEVLKRDKNTCKYCRATDSPLTIDHVIPVTLGGADVAENLVAACKDCNAGKSSVPADAPLVASVADDALRWARAMAVVAKTRADDRAVRQGRHKVFEKHWKAWKFDGPWNSTGKRSRVTVPLPGDWRSSVDQFINAGLDMDDLTELIDVAMSSRSNDEWRYFCGCCWRRVQQSQDQVRALLSSPPIVDEPLLTTSWTDEELREMTESAESFAAKYLQEESIDSASCLHRDWGEGACSDPVCRVIRAEWLSTAADYTERKQRWKTRTEDAIMDEAEVLEDA